jgi:hypothetical protein
MGLIEFPGFIGPSYRLASVNAASERLTNWLPQTIQSPTAGMPNKVIYMPTPGRSAYAEGLDGPPRGMLSQDGRVFVVAGRYLYELDGAGHATSRGYVGTDSEPASLATNGHGANQLMVVSAGKGWILDLTTNTLTQITDPSFPTNVVQVVFLAGYFIVMQAGTSKFFLSDLENGLSWDATNVGETTYSSDTLTAMAVLKGQLWLIGSQRTEVWQNTGATFPFEPVLGAFTEYGTNAPWSLVEASDRLWMLGQNARGNQIVLSTNGLFFNQEVSNYAVSFSLSQVPNLSEGVGYAYQEAGHTFYVLTFPTTGPTWVYDLNEQQWHERGEWNDGLGRYQADRVATHCYGFGRHLVGDHTLGTVYEQSLVFGTDNGTPIRRSRVCPHINQQRQWTFYTQLQVDAETGIGTTTDPNPQLLARYSKDGGHTYSSPIARSLGAGGAYTRQVTWCPFAGAARDLVPEVFTTAQVPVNLLNAYLRLETGTGQS